jgi:allantoicase
MHRAGARFGGDVIAKNDRHFAVIERMPQRQPFQREPGP